MEAHNLKHDTLFVIVGKSGSGKTCLCDLLKERMGLKLVRSYTTRPKRNEYEDNHIFVNSFSEWTLVSGGDHIMAFTTFDGHQYWTTDKQIKESDIAVLDVDGIVYLQRHYHGNKKIRVIYIDVPPLERYCRMTDRGILQAIGRIIHDHFKFRDAKKLADYVVRNDSIEDCYWNLCDYIMREDGAC